MSRRSDEPQDLEVLREKIIGLGERSFRKSYYPQLRQQLRELLRFRALLDQSSDAIFLVEAQSGRLIDVNESSCRQLLLDREKLLSLKLSDIAGPLPSSVTDLLRQEGPAATDQATLETMLLRGNGEKFPAEITLRLVTFGGSHYVIGAARDITERKEAEEALKLTRFSVDHASVCAYLVDRDARFLYVNEQTCRTLGYAREELLAMAVYDLDPDYPLSRWAEHWAHLKKAGSLHFETTQRKKDGAFVPLDMSLNFLAFSGREYNVAFATDISERKKAEEALRTSEANYRAIFDSANDAIFVHDINTGNVISINRKTEEMYGRSLAEFRDFSAEFLFSGEPGYTARDALQWIRRAAEGPPQLFQWLSRRKNGELFWVETNLRQAVIGGETRLLAIVRDISERKKAEEELRQSEQKYRSLFTSIDEGFIICERALGENGRPVDFRLLEANPAFERMIGAPPGGTSGRNMREMIPSIGSFWRDVCEKIGRTGESVRVIRHVKELGRWLEIYAFSRGKGTFALLFNDITDRKTAEEKTSRLLGQLKTIFENIPLGIAYLDADFRFLSVNRFFCNLFSYQEEELIGHHCYDMVGEYAADLSREGSTRICSFCQKEKCIRLKTPTVIERPHGELTLRVHTIPEMDEEGEITRFLEIMEDITSRKRLEESLREGERRFREITESMPQLIWTTDREGSCDFLNRQWIEYTGIPAAEQLGDGWINAVHPEDRTRSWDLWTRFIRGEEDYDLEYRLRRSDGEFRWFKTRGIPIRDERGRTVKIFGSCTDIDDKIRAEESLRAMGAELQRSNRELEQFASIVSHDLREPLRTISGFLNLIRRKNRGQLTQEADEYINYAVEGADRLDRMIRDLLDYSRIQRQEITFQPTPLFDIWKRVAENLRLLIEESGAHITHDPLPVVKGDASQLARLLQNLISNAITYCEGRKPEIHLGVASQDDSWRISVQDNGIGIKPEHQERIFQIFQRLHTRKEYPGTGIGLAICQKIVERHGGHIWVASEPGKGSTFYFTLRK
jgi:PAS domain S-box-containing protein